MHVYVCVRVCSNYTCFVAVYVSTQNGTAYSIHIVMQVRKTFIVLKKKNDICYNRRHYTYACNITISGGF